MSQFSLNIPEAGEQRRLYSLAPLQPLQPIQRLAYLSDVKNVRCLKSFEGRFEPDSSYRVQVVRCHVTRPGFRSAIGGEQEKVEWMSTEIAIYVFDENNQSACFMHRKFLPPNKCIITDRVVPQFDWETFIDHFDPPDVPDVKRLYPGQYTKYREKLMELQKWIRISIKDFSFNEYQLDDLPRACIRDGYILGWDTGLGKTLGLFCWAFVKAGWEFSAHGIVPKMPVLIIGLGDLDVQIMKEGKKYFGTRTVVLENARDLKRWFMPTEKLKVYNQFYFVAYSTLTCRPDLLEICREVFPVIAVDEAQKVKSKTSLIGKAVRSFDPKFRAPITATPIKNRIGDLFQLLFWASGGRAAPHTGFPYGADDHDLFAETFMVKERNLTKEGQRGRKCIRLIPEAACVHEIWKITAPYIIRRRKKDIAGIVPLKTHRLVVPMGKEQHAVYRRHLDHQYIGALGQVAIGAKITALRQAAVCPHSGNLLFRSKYSYTPKVAAVLSVVNEILRRKEPVIIFSSFHETTDTLAKLLCEAKVPFGVADGRNPDRANTSQAFIRGAFHVYLLGDASMAYGHNFNKCPNVVKTSKDWAMDIDEQSIARAWRVDSKVPINFYDFMCRASIEETIDKMLTEKHNSKALCLDGDLDIDTDDKPNVDLFELLSYTVHDFESHQELPIDEQQLMSEWPALRQQLTEAASEL